MAAVGLPINRAVFNHIVVNVAMRGGTLWPVQCHRQTVVLRAREDSKPVWGTDSCKQKTKIQTLIHSKKKNVIHGRHCTWYVMTHLIPYKQTKKIIYQIPCLISCQTWIRKWNTETISGSHWKELQLKPFKNINLFSKDWIKWLLKMLIKIINTFFILRPLTIVYCLQIHISLKQL